MGGYEIVQGTFWNMPFIGSNIESANGWTSPIVGDGRDTIIQCGTESSPWATTPHSLRYLFIFANCWWYAWYALCGRFGLWLCNKKFEWFASNMLWIVKALFPGFQRTWNWYVNYSIGSSKIMSTKGSEEKTSSMSVKPNYSSIFPSAKTKALLHQEEKIGGVRSSAVSMAGE